LATLYLLETKAAKTYAREGCGNTIRRGERHFRHDPFIEARRHRGEKYTHWCRDCIMAANPGEPERPTQRLWVSKRAVLEAREREAKRQQIVRPVRIELLGIGDCLSLHLASNPSLVHRLSPEQFEEFICERLDAMGLEPQRAGTTFRPDGGIDVVFWPRKPSPFPFLGAAQIKHHRNPATVEGPASVRELVGSISGQPFTAGIVVTNTTFSPSAEWFARQHRGFVRLRGFQDIQRWLANNFGADEEWRELPSTIELAPGVTVKVR
jgi:Restriction endonuclease